MTDSTEHYSVECPVLRSHNFHCIYYTVQWWLHIKPCTCMHIILYCVCTGTATDVQKSHDPMVGKLPIKINDRQSVCNHPPPPTHTHKRLRGSALHDMDISLSIISSSIPQQIIQRMLNTQPNFGLHVNLLHTFHKRVLISLLAISKLFYGMERPRPGCVCTWTEKYYS